jgi:serine/threonine protein kinase
METLKHNNIINYIEYGRADIVQLDSSENVINVVKEVNYIVLELAQQGDLFDVIARFGCFDESLARYFFCQFMNGLEYCHD